MLKIIAVLIFEIVIDLTQSYKFLNALIDKINSILFPSKEHTFFLNEFLLKFFKNFQNLFKYLLYQQDEKEINVSSFSNKTTHLANEPLFERNFTFSYNALYLNEFRLIFNQFDLIDILFNFNSLLIIAIILRWYLILVNIYKPYRKSNIDKFDEKILCRNRKKNTVSLR